MAGQASSLSIENDGQNARRHQILLLFAITFENPYRKSFLVVSLEKFTRKNGWPRFVGGQEILVQRLAGEPGVGNLVTKSNSSMNGAS